PVTSGLTGRPFRQTPASQPARENYQRLEVISLESAPGYPHPAPTTDHCRHRSADPASVWQNRGYILLCTPAIRGPPSALRAPRPCQSAAQETDKQHSLRSRYWSGARWATARDKATAAHRRLAVRW